MKLSFFGFCLLFLANLSLLTATNKVFQNQIRVPITDGDLVYARKIALQNLKRKIVFDATRSLMDIKGVEEYQDLIQKEILSQSDNFLLSVKILSEKNNLAHYYLKVSGIVELASLKKSLKSMNVLLKESTWFQASLITTNPSLLTSLELRKRLELFHVKLISYGEITEDQVELLHSNQETKKVSESLFELYGKTRVLYLLENKAKEGGIFKSLKLTVFENSLEGPLNEIELTYQTKSSSENKISEHVKANFLKLIHLKSLRINRYGSGKKALYQLRVLGFTKPSERDYFISTIIEKSNWIRSFSLFSQTHSDLNFDVNIKGSIQDFISSLQIENELLEGVAYQSKDREITLQLNIKNFIDIQKTKKWEFSRRVLTQIRNTYSLSEVPLNLIPNTEEIEPNNSTNQVNQYYVNELLYGRVSSRTDEDLYKVYIDTRIKRLKIDWFRLGTKTDLSPQMKIYSSNFELLSTYYLLGNEKKLKILYAFQDSVPEFVYIRINDRIGYIPIESGGFKSYSYLFRINGESDVKREVSDDRDLEDP